VTSLEVDDSANPMRASQNENLSRNDEQAISVIMVAAAQFLASSAPVAWHEILFAFPELGACRQMDEPIAVDLELILGHLHAHERPPKCPISHGRNAFRSNSLMDAN
jgi:hypothetical protein